MKKLVGLFSLSGKTPEQVGGQAWKALQKFNQQEKLNNMFKRILDRAEQEHLAELNQERITITGSRKMISKLTKGTRKGELKMDDKSDQVKFYTAEEVAKLLLVKSETIRRYVRTGKLRAVKLGGKFIRIEKKDLESFIEQMKQ